MTTKKLTKLLALYLPYILLGLVATNIGEAWRLAEGKELGDKIMAMMGTVPVAFANPLPSLHPLDLLVGLCCGAGLRLAVYLRGKNAKKYRHGMEYGSARWGTAKDIEPFMAPKFADNIILTKTERLMMSNRPPDPKNARNKNVLVVGGSGSGKTRFWLKPNLLQCHSSYVVTDPKGSIVVECGNALLKNGYKLKILNTINFKKSMLIRSRLPDPVGGFIFIPVRKVHQKISLAAVMQRKTTRFRVCTNDRKRFIIKEKRLWNSSTLLSKFFRLWLSLWVPVSAFGVPSTCWKVMVTTTPAARVRA